MLKNKFIEISDRSVPSFHQRERRSMNEGELKEYYNTFTDCWKLFREYHDIGQGRQYDQAWNEVTQKAENIYKKYGTEFARRLAFMVVCELEKQSKTPH